MASTLSITNFRYEQVKSWTTLTEKIIPKITENHRENMLEEAAICKSNSLNRKLNIEKNDYVYNIHCLKTVRNIFKVRCGALNPESLKRHYAPCAT